MTGKAGSKTRSVVKHREGRGTRSRAAAAQARDASLPMLRTSERSTLKMCEWLWDIAYNSKLKPQTEMPALRFGTLIHTALAAYYIPGVKRGMHPAKSFKKAYDADMKRVNEKFGVRVEEDEKWINAEELGVAMMNNYVDEYGEDDEWEVLVTEWPFEQLVLHPDTGAPWFYYVGVIDGVWRHRINKDIWIPDHKTTAGIGDRKMAYLQVDDQAGMYWSYGVDAIRAAGLLKLKQPLAGMLYNFMRKALPDERPSKVVNGTRVYLNQNGSVSAKQPSPYFLRQPIYRDEFDREMAKHRASIDYARIEMFRAGKLPITKSPGMFTCPHCPQRDACELHETGHDWQNFLKATTKTWDPYEEHEIYDGR